ncbi:hypothetical protein Acid345_1582 [Candidatus Koribacter versatilis Ellin345]|uniref:Uncharacterized protein n=1 Tax=Koribacter versatilis (strain Ellin345) TaxID=204669 RepID=Q1IRB6_KORVE|nr:hypothetical protein [Candidatus Koribacter versatilis]ABF40584.1 hypothetical protein Acid345_1582 [Candidatus Koribacter versatilis Ellin345]
MSTMMILLIAWAGLTTILVLLLIYRSTLTLHEDDQIFLSDSDAHLQREQEELSVKVNRLTPFVRLLGAASTLLILFIAGLALYQQLNKTGLE